MTNCVNCGAPTPQSGFCTYCGTSVLVPEADQIGFQSIKLTLKNFMFDSAKVDAVVSYTRIGRRLTVGQVRAVLAEFAFDSDRLRAARHLIPITIDRLRLFEIGNVFVFDSDRAAFLRLVSGAPARSQTEGYFFWVLLLVLAGIGLYHWAM